MSAVSKLEKEFECRSYEVEPDGRLRVVVLARLLQEAAWLHAKALGKGFVDRESGSLFWVLSRLRLTMLSYPSWGDHFIIRTWPVGTQKLLAVRDFSVVAADGIQIIGRATTGWLIVDGSSGRPVRPERIVGDITCPPGEYPGSLDRLPALAESGSGTSGTVRHHDIDQYRHVNNASYLEWMIDEIAQLHDVGTVAELAVDYLREMTAGDEYKTVLSRDSTQTRCEVRSARSAEPVCRAIFRWSPRTEQASDA